jgi:hypothetical protein
VTNLNVQIVHADFRADPKFLHLPALVLLAGFL